MLAWAPANNTVMFFLNPRSYVQFRACADTHRICSWLNGNHPEMGKCSGLSEFISTFTITTTGQEMNHIILSWFFFFFFFCSKATINISISDVSMMGDIPISRAHMNNLLTNRWAIAVSHCLRSVLSDTVEVLGVLTFQKTLSLWRLASSTKKTRHRGVWLYRRIILSDFSRHFSFKPYRETAGKAAFAAVPLRLRVGVPAF